MLNLMVNTSQSYEVVIGPSLLSDIALEISKVKAPGKCIIVSDDIVWALYGESTKSSLIDAGYEVCEFIFENGEHSKNMETVLSILECCFENHLTRSDFAIALGGGIVGDITGFASSIYLRGIDFIQIPTTLLSAIDSSVGGKTGVNCFYGKNLIGAFHQPLRVICDTDTFNTLPYDIYTAGICEALKYGVIRDEKLFYDIADNSFNIEEMIYRCIEIKAEIAAKDEFDHGERQLLNFGHTLAHSIEALSDFNISHGHAVGIGMLLITKACEDKGLCKHGTSDKIRKALDEFKVINTVPYSQKELVSIAMNDKKRKGNTITLVIPEYIGKCILHKIDISELESFITVD
ncbi:MAG: 3-dehydroquinate synthase [Ruminococcaceae bacterium]|nr:3-dehydroquinate synthase [Oscillospiraceae bacterium]